MKNETKAGFTIAELLIVVVVIAILGALSIVGYSSIQDRAKESVRTNDMRAIVTALQVYKLKNGEFPAVAISGLGSQAGWETSAREATGQFIQPLTSVGFPDGVPVDPVNDSIESDQNAAVANGTESYYYYRYSSGYSTCDASKGRIFVLAFGRKSSATAGRSDSPGFSCPGGRDWGVDFRWVTGGFEY